jgi:hypothetical protein
MSLTLLSIYIFCSVKFIFSSYLTPYFVPAPYTNLRISLILLSYPMLPPLSQSMHSFRWYLSLIFSKIFHSQSAAPCYFSFYLYVLFTCLYLVITSSCSIQMVSLFGPL